ncbi:hypothetical protein V6N12_035795 [Hibiscus sabdariffa]|uniref:RNase H type-1 domain-containing protein n=1 Tax=Hibiscus sabdariffa TaxID=183260 RepID=A0ABR2ENR7_9ROSI
MSIGILELPVLLYEPSLHQEKLIGILELSSLVWLLNHHATCSHVNNLLVEEILEFLSRERKVKTSYVRCSLNEVADTLAALSRGQPIGEISFVEPPLQLILQLIKEQQYVSPLIQHPSILNWEMHGVRTSCAIQRKDPGG